MSTVGILKDHRNLENTIFSPSAIKSFNNEVDFIVQSGAGEAMGIADSAYETAGALIIEEQKDILNYSDITIVHDEINRTVSLQSHKLFLTDVDYINHFASLMTMIGEPVSLFSFSNENLKSCPIHRPRSFNSFYLGFLKYYLGEPVSAELISAISMAKVLEKGKIVNKIILDQIELI